MADDVKQSEGGHVTREQIKALVEHLFEYHAPTPLQQLQYTEIRKGAKAFATVLLQNTPPGVSQDAMMLKLREVVMLANGSVALNPPEGFDQRFEQLQLPRNFW